MTVDPTSLCQIEIQVSDIERSVAFYENVFGWSRVPTEIHEYVVLAVPEGCPFGVSLVPSPAGGSAKSRTTLYFTTDDAERVAMKAKAFGGALRFGPKKLPGYGVIYQITDPDGQQFGLFTSAQPTASSRP